MKKQILFLAFLVLAVMAGITNSYAQLTPRTLDCTVSDGPLNPLLGKTYTYSVTIPNTGEFTNGITYQWRVTQDQTFITNGVLSATSEADGGIFAVEGGSAYDATTSTSASIDLSWNSLPVDATHPFFLIIKADGDNSICTATNTKVYMIVPNNEFTLDIANVSDADAIVGPNWDATTGESQQYQQCIDDVQSVVWNIGTQSATYDYGLDTLTFAVTAANWSVSWTPTLLLSGIAAGETVSSVTWSRTPNDVAAGTFTYDGSTYYTTTDVVTPTSGTDVGTDGETIYIRVVLDHTIPGVSIFEGLADQNISLAIDGTMDNGAPDVHWSDAVRLAGTAQCGDADGFDNDVANQTLKGRPGIDTNTSGGADPLLTPVP